MTEMSLASNELLGAIPLPEYNAAERRYGVHVRRTLLELLEGKRNELDLMRKYHREPSRLGAMPVPMGIDAKQLRLSRVEEMLSSAIRFLHDGSSGGPMAQSEDLDEGAIVQRRDFPTRFPHIVIQRTDIYDAQSRQSIRTEWCVHRLQNQRTNIRMNRMLDAMTLGLELLRWVR